MVDDDEDLREVLAELLLVEGVKECISVGSLSEVQARGRQALRAGLAILDVNLGDGQPTGVEVCRWLRAHGFVAPIVFLTGHAANDPRVLEASRVPRTRILAKPVSSRELGDLVGAP